LSNESECLYRCSGVGAGALGMTGFFILAWDAGTVTHDWSGWIPLKFPCIPLLSLRRLLSTDVLSLKLIHYKTKVLSIVLVPSIHQ